jgi:uncharacterized protein (TIGR03032 family)
MTQEPARGPDAPQPQPLRSKHTSNFPAILDELGISLLVTTYQAGKLVVLRADGDRINTHFRDLPRPMGMAGDRQRLAVGTALEIRQFRNLAAVCKRLDETGKHDACYLPRSAHVTSDIDIHEMTWAGDNLWFVNTRFSCLCTLSQVHNFTPCWRPPFVTALAPEDRCHLNGLCLSEAAAAGIGTIGVPIPSFYVTALAATDSPQGWRQHKKDGGILMEAPSGNVLVSGLSMPHSPRLHRNRLWMLESGRGGLGWADLAAGRYQNIADLPGFTRGLDFCGNLAFVGLSQVRESAIFSGIPIAERALAERNCGVWVVDLNSGEIVAFLRFEDAVQEVFAIQVLHGIRYPEIMPEDPKLISESYDLPAAALDDVPPALRGLRPVEDSVPVGS